LISGSVYISLLFTHPPEIDFTRLRFEPFTSDSLQVKSFECVNNGLNDFLCTEEAAKYGERTAKTINSCQNHQD
jgi:hypothetical protein